MKREINNKNKKKNRQLKKANNKTTTKQERTNFKKWVKFVKELQVVESWHFLHTKNIFEMRNKFSLKNYMLVRGHGWCVGSAAKMESHVPCKTNISQTLSVACRHQASLWIPLSYLFSRLMHSCWGMISSCVVWLLTPHKKRAGVCDRS